MKNNSTIRNIAFSGIIAAVSFVVFTFLKIPMPGGTGALHLGNAVVVLGALILGGFWGGLGGTIGLVIADLIGPYAPYAPTTFVLKFAIGLITGLIAHKFGKINEQNDPKKLFMWVSLAAAGALLFNFIFAPLVNYFYNIFIIGKSAADLTLMWNIATSGVNAVASVIVSVVVYMALRPALKKSGFFM
jgi:uncharacterized membrane protein